MRILHVLCKPSKHPAHDKPCLGLHPSNGTFHTGFWRVYELPPGGFTHVALHATKNAPAYLLGRVMNTSVNIKNGRFSFYASTEVATHDVFAERWLSRTHGTTGVTAAIDSDSQETDGQNGT